MKFFPIYLIWHDVPPLGKNHTVAEHFRIPFSKPGKSLFEGLCIMYRTIVNVQMSYISEVEFQATYAYNLGYSIV